METAAIATPSKVFPRFSEVSFLYPDIVLHLRPRHLIRLYRACKAFRDLIRDADYYWTRVAVHLMYAGWVFDKMPKNLLRLQNIPGGYHQAIEQFVAQTITTLRSPPLNLKGIDTPRQAMQGYLRYLWTVAHKEKSPYGRYLEAVAGEIPYRCDVQNPMSVCPYESAKQSNEYFSGLFGNIGRLFFALTNALEDDSTLSIGHKRRLADSVIKQFRMPVVEGIISVRALMHDPQRAQALFERGLAEQNRKYSEYVQNLRGNLRAWGMLAESELADVPAPGRKLVFDTLTRAVDLAFSIPSAFTDHGLIANEFAKCVSLLNGNRL